MAQAVSQQAAVEAEQQQQDFFADELRALRETLQAEYETKLKEVVGEVDVLKTQLE